MQCCPKPLHTHQTAIQKYYKFFTCHYFQLKNVEIFLKKVWEFFLSYDKLFDRKKLPTPNQYVPRGHSYVLMNHIKLAEALN